MTYCKTWWHVYCKHRKGQADKWIFSHFEKPIPTFRHFPCVGTCTLFRSSFINIFRVLKLFSSQMSQNALPSICSWDIIMKLTVFFDTSLMWEEWTHFIQFGNSGFGFLHLQHRIFWTASTLHKYSDDASENRHLAEQLPCWCARGFPSLVEWGDCYLSQQLANSSKALKPISHIAVVSCTYFLKQCRIHIS